MGNQKNRKINMSKKDEAMIKIREQLKKLMSFSTEEPATASATASNFSTIKLQDGTEISIPEGGDLAVGTEVYSIDEAGNQTPLADGDYVLEDGRTITVSGGAVEALAETPTDEKAGETPSNDASNVENSATEPSGEDDDEPTAGEPIEDRVDALESQVAELMELIQSMGATTEAAFSKIKEIASEPATESIKVGKTPTSAQFSSIKSEIEELRELKNKYNTNGGYSFTTKK